jgi:8-oxo-dGTP diphosphatase
VIDVHMGSRLSKKIEVIARGLVIRGNEILVCQNVAGGYCYLPGGHVEFGEAAPFALQRELREEADVAIAVGELALASEGTFMASGKLHHELNLVFHVEHDLVGPVSSHEAEISFQWVDLASLANVDLRPASMKAWLMSGGSDVGWISDIVAKDA